MLSIAHASAQALLSSSSNSNVSFSISVESIDDSNFSSDSFNAIKDASFLTEKDIEYLAVQLNNKPNRITAALLNIFLGGIGIGHFYTGQVLRGLLDILFCRTGIPSFIGLVEGIIWLCDDDERWEARVARWNEK